MNVNITRNHFASPVLTKESLSDDKLVIIQGYIQQ